MWNISLSQKNKSYLENRAQICWLVTYSFGVSFFLKSWWTWSGLNFCLESSPFIKISISSFFCFSVNRNVFLTGNAHPFSSQKWCSFNFIQRHWWRWSCHVVKWCWECYFHFVNIWLLCFINHRYCFQFGMLVRE